MNIAKVVLGLSLVISMPSLGAPAFNEGQVILRLKKGASLKQIQSFAGVSVIEPLVESLGIYLVKLDSRVMSARASLSALKSKGDVQWAQLDHVVTNREVIPNDPEFSRQLSLQNPVYQADIRAPAAWERTTGGKDKTGNDIVVAVVDGGVDVGHDDLKENIWVNGRDFANNGIDDDFNGYVDDVHGWNVMDDSPNTTPDDHATHIAGVIGAKGNNGLLVSGINWDVKIMTVQQRGMTSEVLKAYNYVLTNKILYITSEATRGANIVATNSSFGFNYANCNTEEYPAWNDMYNEMGKVGILSAVATANIDIDVDQEGDVPSTCDSPYVISVTNTTSKDYKFDLAAYGLVSVDIGAPGTSVLSTITGNRVDYSLGTSVATPHIAGAVALMHAAANRRLNRYYLARPAKAALVIKEMLLSSVDKIADLEGRTVSGGRLNLAAAVGLASAYRRPESK